MEEVSSQSAGTSKAVDNVQALAAAIANSGSNTVPPRYIRPEAKADPVAEDCHSEPLPVVDLARLLDPHFSQEESAKLHRACAEWGFFQLVNHGVPSELMEKVKSDVAEFFKLPLEEKMAFAQHPNNLQGFGQAFVLSEDQKLDWGDLFFLIARPLRSRDMMFWPTRPPTFRDTLSGYSLALKRVAGALLAAMARNLGVELDALEDVFRGQPQGLRMNYYPPCPNADEVHGLSPHSDATGLTLLLQLNQVRGLQIKRDGRWLPVQPLQSAFVVNIGDMLEMLSNGNYRSVEHRAMVDAKQERLSIAAFHGPREDAVVGPLPEIAERDGGERYKGVSYGHYMKSFLAAKLDGRRHLESFRH